MGSEWKVIQLNQFVKHQKGFAFKSKDYVSSGIPVVRVSNFTDDSIDISDFKYVSSDIADEKIAFELVENDVVIATVGSWPKNPASVVGKVIRVPITATPSLLNQNAVVLRPISGEKYDKDFLFYLLKNNDFSNYIISTAQGSANQASITLKDIYAYSFPLPNPEERKVLSNILRKLDNKITLNRQINQTLEQMAQTLFKSWFVDFDPVVDNALDAGFFEQDLGFSEELLHRVEVRKAVRESDNFKPLSEDIRRLFPDAFEECAESALGLGGWVPKRWQISTVDDELTVKGGSTPSTANPDFWEQGNIHWTSPKDLSGSQEKIMLDTERKITELGLRKITSGLLPINTVLMSSRAPIGYLAMAKIPVAINQGYIAITTTKRLSQEYVLYWLDSSMDEIKGIAGGTTFAEISKKTFKSISMVIPDSQVIEKYTVTIKSYLNKVTLNAKERGSLEKLRDTLLPKLISGELSLSDIKIDIPEETLI